MTKRELARTQRGWGTRAVSERAVTASKHIVCKYITPYSPELNPIEEFFSMLKNRYYQLIQEQTTLGIGAALDLILSGATGGSLSCEGFYKNMRDWLEKASSMEPFI